MGVQWSPTEGGCVTLHFAIVVKIRVLPNAHKQWRGLVKDMQWVRQTCMCEGNALNEVNYGGGKTACFRRMHLRGAERWGTRGVPADNELRIEA